MAFLFSKFLYALSNKKTHLKVDGFLNFGRYKQYLKFI